MSFSFHLLDLLPVAAELVVMTMACFILVLDLYLREDQRNISYLLSQATLVIAAWLITWLHSPDPRLAFSGTFINDTMSDILKVFLCLVAFTVFLYSRRFLRDNGMFKGEYHVLGLFGVLGMMIMISGHSLLTLYLGLELLSLCLYTLIAFNKHSARASEAAMKFFILGALASGMLLYGMSLLYGATGSLDLGEIGIAVAKDIDNPIVIFGLVFILVGVSFKLGAVPFHMWMPDVYHGAPASVTLYISSIPKLAAFALAVRLLVDGLGPLHPHWQDMLIILSLLSLAVGNIVAIAQTNIKRMLAYSTISHVGFLLLGLLAGTPEGYSAAMFYTLVYTLMALGAFGIVLLLSSAGREAEQLTDLKGLNDRNPWYAFIMLLVMLSMAGVPPTIGFYAKFAVLSAVIDVELAWVAIVAVLFAVIGAFYYLRIIKLMYFDKAETPEPIEADIDVRVLLGINGVSLLLLGIFPASLIMLCESAFLLGH